jgi:TorA maturation chaperone TorD
MDDARQREFVAAAAAGFALSRMLLAAPDDGILERLRDPQARSSWPLTDEVSQAALAGIGAGTEPERIRADWNRVLGADGVLSLRESIWRDVPEAGVIDDLERLYRAVDGQLDGRHSATGGLPADHLAVELLCLAHLAASAAGPLARGERPRAEEACVLIVGLWDRHVDLFWEPAMTEFGLSVETPELQAVPALVGGFLSAIEQLTVPLVVEP